MELWQDIAQWRGPSPNVGGPMQEYRGLVIHIAQGTFEGTISWCKNPTSGVSSHFVVALDGRIAQVVSVDVTAWTQRDGNGHWISVENEGYTPNALTAAQVDANARILAKCHKVKGVPLQLATSPSGRGLGHHSMGAESGANWGHSECPGPNIKNQKPEILSRAVQVVNGGGGGDEMAIHTIWRTDGFWVCGGPGAGRELIKDNDDMAKARSLYPSLVPYPAADHNGWPSVVLDWTEDEVDRLLGRRYVAPSGGGGTGLSEAEVRTIAEEEAREEIAGSHLVPPQA